MPDKTLHFQGDLRLQERNGEWYIEDRQSGDLSGPVNIGNLNPNSITTQELSVSDLLNVTPKGTAPSSPSTDDIYLDDGTNTSDSTVGFRYYDGSAWIDL